MGIQNFNGWLKSTYGNAYISKQQLGSIDNLHIDLNCLLHKCVYQANTSNQVVKRLSYNIKNILDIVNPQKTLVLASDGVPPLAKTLLQRKRRNMSSKKIEQPKPISSLDFTVGSKFMNSLQENLSDVIKEIEKKRKIKTIFMCDDPNEAELKIMHHIKTKNNESHVVVSDDADVVLLTAAIDVDNIYVLSFESKKEKILSINTLLNEHQKKMKCNRRDFVFVSLLLGNDYIPKLNFINIDTLWKAYVNFKNNVEYEKLDIMSNDGKIQLTNLEFFLSFIVCGISNTLNKRTKISKIRTHHITRYLEGITWCFDNYSSGTCQKYDYIYSGKTIQPLDMMHVIMCNKITDVQYPTPLCEPMDKDKYLVLIMPRKAKSLIKNKYHNLIDNELSFMYEEEECIECKTHSKKLSELHKTMIMSKQMLCYQNDKTDDKYVDEITEIYEKSKSDISKINKIMKEHKIKHSPINIHNAINILNSV